MKKIKKILEGLVQMKSEIVSQEGSSKSPHVQTQFDGDALPSGIQQVFFTTVLLFWAQCILNVFLKKYHISLN